LDYYYNLPDPLDRGKQAFVYLFHNEETGKLQNIDQINPKSEDSL
jgi:hypothetical protein